MQKPGETKEKKSKSVITLVVITNFIPMMASLKYLRKI